MERKVGEVDPQIQEAANKFREALDELKKVQDPLSKKILREKAMSLLSEAVDITASVELRQLASSKPKINHN